VVGFHGSFKGFMGSFVGIFSGIFSGTYPGVEMWRSFPMGFSPPKMIYRVCHGQIHHFSWENDGKTMGKYGDLYRKSPYF